MRKDNMKIRKTIAFSIFISLICMNFPLIVLLDFLDFGTNFYINMAYLGSSFILLLFGFYLLLTRKSFYSRFIYAFMIYFGFDLCVMVITNYV